MDYRLTDPYLDPPGGDDSCYSEKSVRLPETYWCYQSPAEIPDVMLSADKLDHEGRVAAPLLIKELGLESTTSNARRLIEQGGFNVGPSRETITDTNALIYVSDGLIVRAGKRKIARIRLV